MVTTIIATSIFSGILGIIIGVVIGLKWASITLGIPKGYKVDTVTFKKVERK